MAYQPGLTVTRDATGASDHIYLAAGSEYSVYAYSDGAFVCDLQTSGDVNSQASFRDIYVDASTKATIDSSTGPQDYRLPGGITVRMNVTTHNDPITLQAVQLNRVLR